MGMFQLSVSGTQTRQCERCPVPIVRPVLRVPRVQNACTNSERPTRLGCSTRLLLCSEEKSSFTAADCKRSASAPTGARNPEARSTSRKRRPQGAYQATSRATLCKRLAIIVNSLTVGSTRIGFADRFNLYR